MGRRRRSISNKRRSRIKVRDGHKCRYCGTRYTREWHIDHVRPVSWGGNDWSSNLALSCRSCNLKKGARLWHPKPIPMWRVLVSVLLIFLYNDWPSYKDWL